MTPRCSCGAYLVLVQVVEGDYAEMCPRCDDHPVALGTHVTPWPPQAHAENPIPKMSHQKKVRT